VIPDSYKIYYSIFSIIALVSLGHLIGMRPDVAISCFIGLISGIITAFFMSFVAFAQEIVRINHATK